ncbi:PREDICTED: collectin-12-like isoform X2 [Acropora digitifera]|uniref:collectin-12-like isoform X2 n=1 Tax=Acropora digitifera TaxID=70779 RepID=UPI00077A6FC4|nr:PREDICTED: collectin-12-like isoform X2 [Acropora digitifera]
MNTTAEQMIFNPAFEDCDYEEKKASENCIYEDMSGSLASPTKREIIFREEIGQFFSIGDAPWNQQHTRERYAACGQADSKPRNGSNRALVVLVSLFCLLSSAAIVLCLLMLLGKINYQCNCRKDESATVLSPPQEARRSLANTEFLAKMKSLEENVTYLHQTLNTRTGELKQLEKSYRFLHSENEFFRTVLQELGANVTAYRLVADQTKKKLNDFQHKTNNAIFMWNNSFAMFLVQDNSLITAMTDLNRTLLQKLTDTDTRINKGDENLHALVKEFNGNMSAKLNDTEARLDKKTVTLQTLLNALNSTMSLKLKEADTRLYNKDNNLQIMLNELNTTMSLKLSQLNFHLSIVGFLANNTKEDVNDLKNNTESLLASLQEKTDRLDQEDVNLRALLKETNNTLFVKVENVSKMQGPVGPAGFNGSQGSLGPPGPQGFNGSEGIQGAIGPQGYNGSQGPAGPQGPKGAGDFSLCEYRTHEEKLTQTPVPGNFHNTPVQVNQAEPAGKRIVGVSCSTDIAQMYLVSSSVNPSTGVRFYHCQCKGHYGGVSLSVSVKCIMNYWLCPLTT